MSFDACRTKDAGAAAPDWLPISCAQGEARRWPSPIAYHLPAERDCYQTVCSRNSGRRRRERSRPESEDVHMLVVDDDERLRALLQKYLSQNGFRVTAAAGAEDARALMKSMAFDLLILDVMMPGESGLDLTAACARSRRLRS